MKPALPKGSPACIDDLGCLNLGATMLNGSTCFDWSNICFSLLRTFSNRQAHKIDSDGLEFFRSFSKARLPRAWAVWLYFYHTLFESCLIFTFFPPGTRISEWLRFLRCAPVQLPGQGPSLRGSSAHRFALLWEVQGKVPGHEQVARFGSWCLVPPVRVPQGSPLVPPELVWILSWQKVNDLVKYAFSVLQFNQD